MPISFSSPTSRDSSARGAGVTAVLGPTNTGKIHLAIERMLGHSSGIIGLPLRLLAREVYNKVEARAGADAVALVTGEEKIKPPSPRYWVSTVEAMPRDLDVAFLAIDEVQLGADLERGHVFTDRILNRRGREETLVLGAQTVRPMIERLLPGAHILTRPRLSQLSFAGEKKITRLPRRSAVVAFSAEEVYSIAELIRRQRGGAAVVLGALSPRTRNAQVALYQSGDVEYLVATDAIGMGLNLDVDHVAFASDRKFDGYQFRRLNPAELAQIAGRAGRATRDGTFGTTGRCPPFETELAQALESHSFEPIKVLQWRNTALDFASVGALQASLAETPKQNGLTRAPIAEDILVLEHAARDEEIRALANTRQAVERLWDVCQVPDYRKISPATHAELATTLYGFLMREGSIPTDWFARQVEQADRTEGDIDTLSNRIAHIRTWTFAANRPDWLVDPEHWQGVTRAVEDKLSDALHERLTERFVDRRTSVLMRRLRENAVLETDISKTGEVMVEGHAIGRLDGFMFTPAASAAGSEAKALAGAAQKALAGEIDTRATRLAQAADGQFVLASDGTIRWLGQPVGKLFAAEEILKPRVRIIADEHLTGAPRDAVQARLDLWLKSHIERLLEPLFRLAAAEDITGIARGVAFQLMEALGVLERQKVANGRQGPRPAGACDLAQIRGTLRCVSHLPAGAAQTGAADIGDPTVGAQTRRHGEKGARGDRATCRQWAHLDRRRRGNPQAALPHRRLSRLRRARRAGRHLGAARRPHSSRARMALRRGRRQAAGRHRRLRFQRHRRHDVACRLLGGEFRLGAALARLSHGTAAEAGRAGARAGGSDSAAVGPCAGVGADDVRDRCARA